MRLGDAARQWQRRVPGGRRRSERRPVFSLPLLLSSLAGLQRADQSWLGKKGPQPPVARQDDAVAQHIDQSTQSGHGLTTAALGCEAQQVLKGLGVVDGGFLDLEGQGRHLVGHGTGRHDGGHEAVGRRRRGDVAVHGAVGLQQRLGVGVQGGHGGRQPGDVVGHGRRQGV